MELFDYRKDYLYSELLEENVANNPFEQFKKWFSEAEKAKITEPNAFNLATCDKDGKPSCRVVLLKEVLEDGFTFFTNYESRKGKSIEENSFVAINFFWNEIQRQVRIEGKIEKLSKEDSEKYFHLRPKANQIGAWASKQSQFLSSRKELEEKYKELEEEYKDKEVPLPNNWGGYIIKPDSFEFWQGRTSRLHDRIFFEKKDGIWSFIRLYP